MKLPRLPRPRRAPDDGAAPPKAERRRPSARAVSDAAELAGLACLDGAAWWIQPLAGLVTLGLVLLLIGWVIGE